MVLMFLVGALLWTIGASLFGAYICMRLSKLSEGRDRRLYRYMTMSKIGYGLTAMILAYRIAEGASRQPAGAGSDPLAFAYIIGLLIAGIGFTGVATLVRDRLVDLEDTRGMLGGEQ